MQTSQLQFLYRKSANPIVTYNYTSPTTPIRLETNSIFIPTLYFFFSLIDVKLGWIPISSLILHRHSYVYHVSLKCFTTNFFDQNGGTMLKLSLIYSVFFFYSKSSWKLFFTPTKLLSYTWKRPKYPQQCS